MTATENVLYSFTGGPTDGVEPHAGLIADAKGDLFGTTQNGGAYDGYGTVFEITDSGFVPFAPLVSPDFIDAMFGEPTLCQRPACSQTTNRPRLATR
jgi:hypothetical protein